MKMHLRNITVTLDEAVARWARIEAAKREMSVSRFLGSILKEKMADRNSYARAMRRAFARRPFLKSEGHYPTRGEAHERAGLR